MQMLKTLKEEPEGVSMLTCRLAFLIAALISVDLPIPRPSTP